MNGIMIYDPAIEACDDFLKDEDILFDILEIKRRKGWERIIINNPCCNNHIWHQFGRNEYILVTADLAYTHKMTNIVICDNSIEFHCKGRRHRVYRSSIKTMNLYDKDDFVFLG